MIGTIARATAGLSLLVVVMVGVWPHVPGPQLLLPAWTGVPGAVALYLFLVAPALWLSTRGHDLLAQRLSAAALGVAALALASWLLTAASGSVQAAALADPPEFWGRTLSLRPTLLTAFGMAALAGALWARDPASTRVDPASLLATLAAAVFFLAVLGHLFGATALSAGPGRVLTPSTGLSATLLFALSLGVLGLHRGGPMAAYGGAGPGPVAKRRLLPAAIATPIAMGFLLLYALDSGRLGATLAIALTVFANVAVMLFLADRAGNKVAQMDQERQERMRAREERVRRQGMRDALTGSLNRRGWDEEVQAVEARCRDGGLDAGVIVIDLDGLKAVNDTQGHKAGDGYIQRAAGALRRVARRRDVLARVGGDEFAYVAVGCDEEATRAVAARLQESLRQSKVSASVGYAMRGRRTLSAAFEEADQAMYQHKRARKNRGQTGISRSA